MKGATVGWSILAGSLAASSGCKAADRQDVRHLIYLHGRIIQEEQSPRPKHPQYGYYELEQILGALRERGFVVSGEIRPKDASVGDSADRVVAQVQELLHSGVPADHITVVGASMGATITFLASARLQNGELRFCTLGACLSANVRSLVEEQGKGPMGHFLSIREASDDTGPPCPDWSADVTLSPGLDAREIVLHTGLSHGFFYRPIPEWVEPVVEWAKAEGEHRAGEPASASQR